MSSIPNSAMPRVIPSAAATTPAQSKVSDRVTSRLRAVPVGAWIGGAAAIGLATAAGIATLARPAPKRKTRRTAARRKAR